MMIWAFNSKRYSRSFFNDIHDDCVNTEDDEYCYEDMVDALYVGNLK